MKPTLIRRLLLAPTPDTRVTVNGWVKTRRDSKGGFSFIELNDGSCLGNLQVLADSRLANYASEVPRLDPGSTITVTGLLVASPGSGQAVELQAETLLVHGYCPAEGYPLQKKRIPFEVLRELAHLRPRTNTFGAVARVRNALSFATHRFFQENDFLYLHTPIITASDCEGAGQMFRVTTLDLAKLPRTPEGQIDFKEDFFGQPANLTVSGQLNGETYACALGRIYTFGPTFRAENSNTSRHLAEFWMIEPEMAFATLEDDADLAEAYLKYCFRYLLEHCGEDLAFFEKWVQAGLLASLASLAESRFQRLSYTEAIKVLEQAKEPFEFPVSWGMDLQSEHERYLTEKALKGPVVVTDFPKDIKAFYMRLNDDGRTVRAMDVLVPKVGELIGGSQREERLEVITARMAEMKLPTAPYWWYLDLRRYGTVPHAGFGLGFERLVQFCTGMANIRDVIPFPRTPKHAEF